jgi:hypothetical protein
MFPGTRRSHSNDPAHGAAGSGVKQGLDFCGRVIRWYAALRYQYAIVRIMGLRNLWQASWCVLNPAVGSRQDDLQPDSSEAQK